ncbi:unnamed protein product [Arabis nemorensis]|uniref:TCTP domain-containing protein n=1 Tax=Arabis nemorensis TaxID=586526 RepID=A0A565BUQ6_9BRAS|nr:unnamed protein product [Arabis nemorensis]
MLVYQDLLTGDELLSDSGKWIVLGALDVNIGANPSAEVGGEDESVHDQAVKVIDIVDTYRLQEQPSFDKKTFIAYVKKYIELLIPNLDAEQEKAFKKGIEGATNFLVSKLVDLQFFAGEEMHDEGILVFCYYKEGATNPTFWYFAHGLKEIRC